MQAVDHLVANYLTDRVMADELAPGSVPVIRSVLRRWLRWTASPPRTWQRDDVIRWLAQPQLRPNTRKSMLTKLRPFCHWLMDHDYLRVDPTRGVKAKAPELGDPRDLDPGDVTRLLRVVPDDRAELIVLLMVHCGLRCSDLARVMVGDVDRRRHNLHVRGKGGRGGYTHWVPIPDEGWRVLARWVATHATGPLIPAYNDPHSPLQGHTISKLVVGWINDAGLKRFPYDGISGHSLRHSCAQHMLDGGAQIRQVQMILHHRSVKTTEIYLRRDPPGLRAAVEGRTYLAG